MDEALRPTELDGAPIQKHWHVAGDLLAGPDPVADRCGSGLALLSGWVAANRLAEGLS